MSVKEFTRIVAKMGGKSVITVPSNLNDVFEPGDFVEVKILSKGKYVNRTTSGGLK